MLEGVVSRNTAVRAYLGKGNEPADRLPAIVCLQLLNGYDGYEYLRYKGQIQWQ